jgi:hypothetical protein
MKWQVDEMLWRHFVSDVDRFLFNVLIPPSKEPSILINFATKMKLGKHIRHLLVDTKNWRGNIQQNDGLSNDTPQQYLEE